MLLFVACSCFLAIVVFFLCVASLFVVRGVCSLYCRCCYKLSFVVVVVCSMCVAYCVFVLFRVFAWWLFVVVRCVLCVV